MNSPLNSCDFDIALCVLEREFVLFSAGFGGGGGAEGRKGKSGSDGEVFGRIDTAFLGEGVRFCRVCEAVWSLFELRGAGEECRSRVFCLYVCIVFSEVIECSMCTGEDD